MHCFRWQGPARNFGDELNALLWPALLPPGWFNADPAVRFLGIGSVLDARHPPGAIKIVAGAGFGGYEAPARLDARWIIHWVRGPRTARALGLPEAAGLGDPAALIGAIAPARAAADTPRPVGFMPHFESAASGRWEAPARLAGLRLIDPRGEPAAVLAALASCRLILSEAMHGAIVADALRIPWIGLRPRMAVHRAKWLDWADSLAMTPDWHSLPPSNMAEALRAATQASPRPLRRLIAQTAPLSARLLPERLLMRAAAILARLATLDGQLSDDAALERSTARMQAALARLARTPFASAFPIQPIPSGHASQPAEPISPHHQPAAA